MTRELKFCPFCGGSNLEVVSTPQGYFIGCSCGCFTGDFETEAEAIDAWNTRAQIPGEVCEIEGTGEGVQLPLVEERTCKNVGYYTDPTRFKCSVCGYNGWVKHASNGRDEVPNYCPGCGKQVVDA